jgi:hypothetical protein
MAVTVIQTNEKKVTITSAKPVDVPLPPKPQVKPTTPIINASQGPSYNDAFAQFLKQSSKPAPAAPKTSDNLKNIMRASTADGAVTPAKPPSNRGRKRIHPILQPQQQQQWTNLQLQMQQQQPQMHQQHHQQHQYQNELTQKVKTEKIQQGNSLANYTIQENTVVNQDGQQQKMYYTVLDSTPNQNFSYPQHFNKISGQYYGQQQQQSF